MIRRALGITILAAFVFVALFGLILMMDGSNGRMQGDCPFSVMGVPLCPQDTQAAVIHHLSSFQSFLSVPVPVTTLTPVLAFAALIFLVFLIDPPWVRPVAFPEYFYHTPLVSRGRKITRWLSLLENSPSSPRGA
ncbi:hypothetical protein HY968_04545 [Candidatus Kaiserbacteria bacterium]|nr:hypothetical protein [Candidatus Kaiserbacteria bacterium]